MTNERYSIVKGYEVLNCYNKQTSVHSITSLLNEKDRIKFYNTLVFDNNNGIYLINKNAVFNKQSPVQRNASTIELARYTLNKSQLNIKALQDWYSTLRCKRYFKKMYNSLEQLEYLKSLLGHVTK